MSTGPEPTTAPPPAYNPDPAVTGATPPAPPTDTTPHLPPEFYFTIVCNGIARRLMAVSFALWHYATSVAIPDPDHPGQHLGYSDPDFTGFVYPPAPSTPPAAWWQLPTPFKAHARPAAACWLLTFKFPGDPLPTHRQAVTQPRSTLGGENGQPYDLNVDKTLTDGGGVTWLRVWPSPELWILADEAQP